jgi:hypothetical protein
MDGAGHWLNPTTHQCMLVTTHNDWIRNAENAINIGLPDELYWQIMLLPDTAVDEIRILALKGGLVRMRQHRRYVSVQFWATAAQVEATLQALVRALEELEVHPDERLEIDNLCLGTSVSITLRSLRTSDQTVFQRLGTVAVRS